MGHIPGTNRVAGPALGVASTHGAEDRPRRTRRVRRDNRGSSGSSGDSIHNYPFETFFGPGFCRLNTRPSFFSSRF